MERLSRSFNIEKPLPDDEDPGRACFFTYKDLKKATRNFEHKIGDGGYGQVYKGKLPDKRTVAVKVLKVCTSQKSLEQFENEVKLLSRLRHPNLVVFYGSTKPPELLLVYEFVPNHTLKYHLHDQRLPFVWPLRLQIAIEIAQGLSYLHSATPPIIHRDVKTDNVLLDHAFHVKIADFGLSRLLPADESDVTTKTRSTAGYEDPEYKRRLKFTLKSDVYSFGVVLVELLSRKKAVDIHRGDGNIFLDEIAPSMIMNNELENLVDPDIGYHSDDDARRIIDSVAQLALKCLQPRGDTRPPMIEVLGVLKEINDEMQHLTVFTEMINEMRQIQVAQQEVIAHIYIDKELKKATNSFSQQLGQGGFGTIYRGSSGSSMGLYRSTPKTDKFSEDGENTRLRYGLSSMQGWHSTMEDAHAALPDLDDCTSFFGVYDGHGGKVVAKFCAKYLHRQMLKTEAYSAGDLDASVQKAFLRMDKMMRGQRGWRELAILGNKMNKFTGMIEGLIWSLKDGAADDQDDNWAFEEGPHSDFTGPMSGCTACVAVIRKNQLVVGNAGDSRCIISRMGQAYNLSRDHKPELEAERERILKAGGFIHAGRVNGSLNLTRAIGDMEFKQNKFLPAEKQIVTANPDINTVELCDDDEFIVLACDGIWDCMSSQTLVDFIHECLKTETRLSTVCERVLDRCLAPSTIGGDGCDNMTMILVQFKKPGVKGVII